MLLLLSASTAVAMLIGQISKQIAIASQPPIARRSAVQTIKHQPTKIHASTFWFIASCDV
jgi:hypothetical protein